jgi:hypothetical protein
VTCTSHENPHNCRIPLHPAHCQIFSWAIDFQATPFYVILNSEATFNETLMAKLVFVINWLRILMQEAAVMYFTALLWCLYEVAEEIRGKSQSRDLYWEPADYNMTVQPTRPHRSTCATPRIVRQKNMSVSPAELGTINECAGEGQKQFTRPTQITKR